MKKKKIIAGSFVISVITAVIAFCLTACGTDAAVSKIAAPSELSVSNDEILTWAAVENAAGYIVDINGTEYETAEPSLDIMTLTRMPNKYEIKVMARGNGESGVDSDWSAPVTVEVRGIFPKSLGLREIDGGAAYEIGAYEGVYIQGKLYLPESYEGKPITRIGENAFINCDKLVSVVIPDSITEIGKRAFKNCSALERVVLPSRLDKLESEAFSACKKLKRVIFPDYLTEIGPCAFEDCTGLLSVELPTGLVTIKYKAFMLCPNLCDVKLPSTLYSIESNAFVNSGITELFIPHGVAKIDGNVFKNTSRLESITVDDRNKAFRSEGNCLIRRSDSILITGCNKSDIPSSVKIIGHCAFQRCYTLEKAVLPEDITTIEDLAFAECKALKEINIPSSVREIGSNPFLACTGLEQITVSADNAHYYSQGNCIIRSSDNVLISGTKNSVIPNGVTEIGICAFSGQKDLKSIDIPQGVSVIGGEAFRGSGLTEVFIPNGVKKIEFFAFFECKELKAVYLPAGIEMIGDNAFRDIGACGFVLDGSIGRIRKSAFGNATIYTTAPKIPDRWRKYDNVPQGIGIPQFYDAFVSSTLLMGCEFGYDGEYPYVKSYLFNSYTISMFSVQGENGLLMVVLTAPVRCGYEFSGWSFEENGEIAFPITDYDGVTMSISHNELLNLEQNTRLYAIWTKKILLDNY